MQILPGLYLINGFPYGRHQNGYLIRAERAAIVIDSGDLEDESFSTVERACRRWGFDVSQVTHLLQGFLHYGDAHHNGGNPSP
jgi:hypothetical protein